METRMLNPKWHYCVCFRVGLEGGGGTDDPDIGLIITPLTPTHTTRQDQLNVVWNI